MCPALPLSRWCRSWENEIQARPSLTRVDFLNKAFTDVLQNSNIPLVADMAVKF
jgi:hypothetical protein